jgi:hypothetical protein
MSKRLILILALAFVVGLSLAAYAEVQNVKVSGDLNVKGVARNNFDLAKTPVGSGFNNVNLDDSEADLLSITRVRVDADLTDNVSATVRLLNERNWNGESTTGNESNRNIGLTSAAGAEKETQIDLDLAYVTLKEFLYSPMTLKVGRQELRFGNGWIVGDPDTNGIALKSSLAEGDLSSRKAFDAVRITLDYNPLVLDGIYAKIAEKNTVLNDDTTLYGVNAAYALDKNTTLEGFLFSKIRGASDAEVTHLDTGNATAFSTSSAALKDLADQVYTVGGRVVNTTVKNLALDIQGAYQFGIYNPKFDPNARYTGATATQKADTAKRSAWGMEAAATYDLKDCSMLSKYSPSVTGVFVYLSGEGRDRVGTETYNGWDGMFEDQTFGRIINAIMGFSNVKLSGVNVKAKPIEDLTVSLDYVAAFLNRKFTEGRRTILSGVPTARAFRMGDKSYLGQEFDLTLTYDYTEDVQFSLLGGVFLPGEINESIDIPGQSTTGQKIAATELIGSMKVTF